MDIPITVLISVVAGLLGIFFGYKGHERSQRAENRDEGKQSGVVLTEIGYIKSSLDDIKLSLREQARINTDLFERLAATESSAKQAHHRIDGLADQIAAIK
jgi:hypothetical protein